MSENNETVVDLNSKRRLRKREHGGPGPADFEGFDCAIRRE